MIPMNRLPPLSALRALDAVARELSFTRAAEELHVTQSAVSHQIRHIEKLWGFSLFRRRGRSIILTPEAQAIVPIVRDFLERLSRTLNELTSEGARGALRVSLMRSVAFKWLVPRLGRFNQAHPDIDVWISTTEELVDFETDQVDMAIRLGDGKWPGLHTTPFLHEYVFPVCSPQLFDRYPEPQEPQDLLELELPLLRRHAIDNCPKWRDWFRDAHVPVRSLPKGSRFPDTSMAVQAAIDGQGIALARSAHVEDDLEAGRLIKLFDVYSKSYVSYYIVCALGRELQPRITAFRDWLLREAIISQAEFDRVGLPRARKDAIAAFGEQG